MASLVQLSPVVSPALSPSTPSPMAGTALAGKVADQMGAMLFPQRALKQTVGLSDAKIDAMKQSLVTQDVVYAMQIKDIGTRDGELDAIAGTYGLGTAEMEAYKASSLEVLKDRSKLAALQKEISSITEEHIHIIQNRVASKKNEEKQAQKFAAGAIREMLRKKGMTQENLIDLRIKLARSSYSSKDILLQMIALDIIQKHLDDAKAEEKVSKAEAEAGYPNPIADVVPISRRAMELMNREVEDMQTTLQVFLPNSNTFLAPKKVFDAQGKHVTAPRKFNWNVPKP